VLFGLIAAVAGMMVRDRRAATDSHVSAR
jgi:hypothetical protein